jgi:phosphoribosylformimino-5-aminoimidazole carboxamide ribotide isomerase
VQIYPAIDIQDGRLARGRAGSGAGAADPVAVAAALLAAGASWLHVVDLDRAHGAGRDNDALVRAICALPGARVQVGGLLQRADEVTHALGLGAARAVIATVAAADAAALARIAAAAPPVRLAVSVDVRAGRLAGRGTSAPFQVAPVELLRRAVARGIRVAVYRDLDRDGTLGGADVAGAASLLGCDAEIVLAGGISSAADVRAARDAGLDGAIVGRALHEGRLTLPEALACSR